MLRRLARNGRRGMRLRRGITFSGLLLLALALALAAFALGAPGRALAHTELTYWTVEPGPAGGDQLRVRYSEPIDGRFLTISLLDLQGQVVKTEAPSIDPVRRTDGLVALTG